MDEGSGNLPDEFQAAMALAQSHGGKAKAERTRWRSLYDY